MESARSPRPRQRRVTAEFLIPAGWVSGTLMVPESQSLADFLGVAGPFLKLADARLPWSDKLVGFFALQRSSVGLIAPLGGGGEHVETAGGAGITSPWSIACVFDQGMLHGRLDFLVNLRLSDYLLQQTGFLIVRTAVWEPLGPQAAGKAGQRWPVALINPLRVLGLVEGEQQRGGAHPGRLAPTEWDS